MGEQLKKDCPHIVIGTPGRTKQLVNEGDMKLDGLEHFILDECDKCLEKTDMRGDVQEIFLKTPKKKQVMMFSATWRRTFAPSAGSSCRTRTRSSSTTSRSSRSTACSTRSSSTRWSFS